MDLENWTSSTYESAVSLRIVPSRELPSFRTKVSASAGRERNRKTRGLRKGFSFIKISGLDRLEGGLIN
jgi:hypothetical protein